MKVADNISNGTLECEQYLFSVFAGQASAYLSENAMELMKLVYHFILCDIHSNEDRFSERVSCFIV